VVAFVTVLAEAKQLLEASDIAAHVSQSRRPCPRDAHILLACEPFECRSSLSEYRSSSMCSYYYGRECPACCFTDLPIVRLYMFSIALARSKHSKDKTTAIHQSHMFAIRPHCKPARQQMPVLTSRQPTAAAPSPSGCLFTFVYAPCVFSVSNGPIPPDSMLHYGIYNLNLVPPDSILHHDRPRACRANLGCVGLGYSCLLLYMLSLCLSVSNPLPVSRKHRLHEVPQRQ